MTSIIEVAKGIGNATVEKLKKFGIDSIEKLASSKIEDLLNIDGVGVADAKMYIQFAQKHIERIQAREKIYTIITKGVVPNVSPPQQKVRVLKPIEKKDRSNVPISWIKKLASSNLEDVSKLEDMGVQNPKRYIEIAKKYLENMRTKEKLAVSGSRANSLSEKQLLGFVKFDNIKSSKLITPLIPPKQKKEVYQKQSPLDYKPLKKPSLDVIPTKKISVLKDKKTEIAKEDTKKPPVLKTFFSNETMQEIRFFHFKIKKLEEALERNESFSFSDLNNVIEYVKLLNVNYKTQSQIRIFKELDITPSFYDPIAKKEIKIWDLIFECSRVLWTAAKAYSYLSNKFETENSMEKAIVAMVECSKMYKTAAYFSAACTRQEDKGIALSVENLELNSEESRIFAQNYATLSEESKENCAMAANLSSGLSALTKRLAFLRKYDYKKECQFKAQYNY
ncbi:MAG: helix-hairpin-helix domain-containing protein, partial [Candidatus Odinarchaeota archaeon]